MRDDETGATSGLPVWRRSRSGTAVPAEEEFPMQCGGPDLTYAETEAYLEEREAQRKREKEEAEAREREEAEERQAARHPSAAGGSGEREDEDEERVAERYRNDRYSVKLLRQDESVWGGGGADTGMLG